ncbi:MAG: hypothetical protein P4M11_08345, partial [Candidatus Pacebacteria bacterium]|nr:hypothetical protein [Candidatus Paceibacterota bacterium]
MSRGEGTEDGQKDETEVEGAFAEVAAEDRVVGVEERPFKFHYCLRRIYSCYYAILISICDVSPNFADLTGRHMGFWGFGVLGFW